MEEDELTLEKQHQADEESAREMGTFLLNLLSPAAAECTAVAASVRASQTQLDTQLNKLEAELNRANACLTIPFDTVAYIKKIAECKKRLAATTARMNTVDARITKMSDGLKKAVPEAFSNHTEDTTTVPTTTTTTTTN